MILLNVSVLITATALTLELTAGAPTWARGVGLGVLMIAVLIVSEALPKAVAVRNPDATALALAGPLSLISKLVWPVVAFVDLITRPLVERISGESLPHTPLVTEEELRLLVNVGEEEGLIEHDEREMIEGIFSFDDTLLREIMVPRVDIVALDIDTTLEEAINAIIDEGHSRIPVYRDTIDTIVGILYAKDLFPALRNGWREMSLQELIRPAHFVPETVKVNALLADMQKRKVHMAIAVDEYGGTVGLATIEDLIEQIVGEIQDEYDVEEPSMQVVGEHELIVDARVPIDDINDMTGLSLEASESDRIGGLVYERLGRVAKIGDKVTIDGVEVVVLSMTGVHPHKLRITYPPPLEVELPGTRQSERGANGST
jgi:CBS domain containing-hemolysin-like protein